MHIACFGFQQFNSKEDFGILELLKSYHGCFWDYNNFVFKDFDPSLPLERLSQ